MNIKEQIKVLKEKDPILGEVIDQIGIITIPHKEENTFIALSNTIIYQQLAGNAAKSIYGRFKALCNNEIAPKKVQSLSLEELRTAGLSERKALYLKDLARNFIKGMILPENFSKLSNEKIMEKLMAVKGIGPWTVEMFLIFNLNRPDVFSAKDLGLHKGICKLYNKKYPLTEKELNEIAEKWSPHRTLASLYLWKIKDRVNFEPMFID